MYVDFNRIAMKCRNIQKVREVGKTIEGSRGHMEVFDLDRNFFHHQSFRLGFLLTSLFIARVSHIRLFKTSAVQKGIQWRWDNCYHQFLVCLPKYIH